MYALPVHYLTDGPKANQSMNSWLIRAFAKELYCAGGIAILFWIFSRQSPLWIFSLIGMGTLGIVLFQGGLYWLLKRRRGFKLFTVPKRLRFIKGLYAINNVLLLAFPVFSLAALTVNSPLLRLSDWTIGFCCYLFACGEFLHYFIFKINMSRSEQKRALSNRQPATARLLRELRRAKQETSRLRYNPAMPVSHQELNKASFSS